MDIEADFTAISVSAAVAVSVSVNAFALVWASTRTSELVAESVTDRLLALVAVSVSEAVEESVFVKV